LPSVAQTVSSPLGLG
jgi:hypothetical protein